MSDLLHSHPERAWLAKAVRERVIAKLSEEKMVRRPIPLVAGA